MAASMKVFILILAGAFMWGSFSDDDVKMAPSRTQQIDTRYIEQYKMHTSIKSRILKLKKGDIARDMVAVTAGAVLVKAGISGFMHPYVDSIFIPIGVLIAGSGVYHCARVLHRLRANAESIK